MARFDSTLKIVFKVSFVCGRKPSPRLGLTFMFSFDGKTVKHTLKGDVNRKSLSPYPLVPVVPVFPCDSLFNPFLLGYPGDSLFIYPGLRQFVLFGVVWTRSGSLTSNFHQIKINVL